MVEPFSFSPLIAVQLRSLTQFGTCEPVIVTRRVGCTDWLNLNHVSTATMRLGFAPSRRKRPTLKKAQTLTNY